MSKSKVTESEDQLVSRAQSALSHCNWEIGDCAAKWTQKYAAGRTDVDFGALIGLSGDQVYQRRRVWERFAETHAEYPQLKWSHFYVALNWEEAEECLRWANDMEATVAEMKAWRRSQQGEDLQEAAAEEPPFNLGMDTLSAELAEVRLPGDAGRGQRSSSGRGGREEDGEFAGTAVSAAREAGGDNYAPFSKGARGPAPSAESATSKDSLSTEQVISRAASALERVVSALTPEVLGDFSELNLTLQRRFLDAVENLQARSADLGAG